MGGGVAMGAVRLWWGEAGQGVGAVKSGRRCTAALEGGAPGRGTGVLVAAATEGCGAGPRTCG